MLYLSPTKALAQDQLASLRALGVSGLAATTHDGDSPREQRDWARDHGEYLLSNPDMLHHSMLPGHARWSKFFSLLQFVVIDEAHHYRGVFGAHVAQIIRRLRRVLRDLRLLADLRARIGDRRIAGGVRVAIDRSAGHAAHRGRLPARDRSRSRCGSRRSRRTSERTGHPCVARHLPRCPTCSPTW